MRENPVPVCSPQAGAAGPQPGRGGDRGAALLQQSTRPYAWRQWFGSLGMQLSHDMTGTRHELFSMLAQAAMHHMGVALIRPS